jgi:hypothetical protein
MMPEKLSGVEKGGVQAMIKGRKDFGVCKGQRYIR